MTGFDYAERLAKELLDVINSKQGESNSLEALAAAAILFGAVGEACIRPQLKPPSLAVRAVEDVRVMLSNMMPALETEHEPAACPHFVPGPRGPQ